MRDKQFEKASHILKWCVDVSPHRPSAHYILGLCCEHLQMYDRARSSYHTASTMLAEELSLQEQQQHHSSSRPPVWTFSPIGLLECASLSGRQQMERLHGVQLGQLRACVALHDTVSAKELMASILADAQYVTPLRVAATRALVAHSLNDVSLCVGHLDEMESLGLGEVTIPLHFIALNLSSHCVYAGSWCCPHGC